MSKTAKRQELIQQVAEQQGNVSVGALAEMLGVSTQTIRRDLDMLCDGKTLRRSHGHIQLAGHPQNTPFDERTGTNPAGKRAIAEAVAAHIPDGAAIFLSIGSTVLNIAQALRSRKELIVITNNLSAAMALSHEPSNRIILPGGELRLPDRDFVGEEVAAFFSRYRAKYAIFGTAGVDAEGVLLEFNQSEVHVTEQMRHNAQTAILAIDHSKFGRLAPAVGANLSKIDRIICDRPPPPSFSSLIESLETRIEFAEEIE